MSLVRVACHVHSSWSYDGKWPLERLAGAFFKRGYQVVMVTEHDQGFNESKRLQHREACQRASSANILLVPGIEYSDADNVIHLLVWGDVPFIGSGVASAQVLRAARESGGVAVMAHPSRKEAWKRFDPSWSEMLAGIEFWNRKTDGWGPSKEAWTLLERTRLAPFAGLDFHDRRQFFPMATLLEMPTPASETTVLEAVREGRTSSKVFGLDAAGVAQGLQAEALRGAEGLRRGAARVYRRAEAKFKTKGRQSV